MKKPNTKAELLEMINGMEHRERFCFKLAQPSQSSEMLEVYTADRLEGVKMGEDACNVLFQTVNVCGKFNKEYNVKRAMLRKKLNGIDDFGNSGDQLLGNVMRLIHGSDWEQS
jgi:hypothetical protein